MVTPSNVPSAIATLGRFAKYSWARMLWTLVSRYAPCQKWLALTSSASLT